MFIFDQMWLYFTACFTLFLLTSWIMKRQSRYFFTMGHTRQRFSIFDLEFPATSAELIKLIKGIDELPNANEAKVSKTALRSQLLTDFLFMLAVYPAVFMLCMKTASKMQSTGQAVFVVLAYLQVLPLLFDVIENCYLLNKLKQPVESAADVHRAYRYMVIAKWAIACTGAVTAFSGLTYFWVTGSYHENSVVFFVIMLIEIVLFVMVSQKKKKVSY
ncbi:hypothetical protein [Rubrolithibacter danxiaensis]|uniref:hypothetical protein n=1 Tax=Rubrolithibacter danxiaensis TaxID=3390805 RepID=UPI003BF824ED